MSCLFARTHARTRTHTHTHSHTHTHTHTQSLTYAHPQMFSRTRTPAHSFSHTRTLAHALSHTSTHTHTQMTGTHPAPVPTRPCYKTHILLPRTILSFFLLMDPLAISSIVSEHGASQSPSESTRTHWHILTLSFTCPLLPRYAAGTRPLLLLNSKRPTL